MIAIVSTRRFRTKTHFLLLFIVDMFLEIFFRNEIYDLFVLWLRDFWNDFLEFFEEVLKLEWTFNSRILSWEGVIHEGRSQKQCKKYIKRENFLLTTFLIEF